MEIVIGIVIGLAIGFFVGKLMEGAHDGQLKLTFEVIYGHALKPAKRLKLGPEVAMPLEDMRRALRQGRNGP